MLKDQGIQFVTIMAGKRTDGPPTLGTVAELSIFFDTPSGNGPRIQNVTDVVPMNELGSGWIARRVEKRHLDRQWFLMSGSYGDQPPYFDIVRELTGLDEKAYTIWVDRVIELHVAAAAVSREDHEYVEVFRGEVTAEEVFYLHTNVMLMLDALDFAIKSMGPRDDRRDDREDDCTYRERMLPALKEVISRCFYSTPSCSSVAAKHTNITPSGCWEGKLDERQVSAESVVVNIEGVLLLGVERKSPTEVTVYLGTEAGVIHVAKLCNEGEEGWRELECMEVQLELQSPETVVLITNYLENMLKRLSWRCEEEAKNTGMLLEYLTRAIEGLPEIEYA